MKNYILKLLTVAAVVFTFIGSFAASVRPIAVFTANGAEIYENDTLSDYARQVAEIVNRERISRGLKALKYSETLSQAANTRAKEIQTYFSHTRPNGTSCFTAVTEMGVKYRYIGENIAYGQRSPEEVMNAWMNSEGHRANILNTNFEYIGIGVTERNGVYYWTQFFAASDDLEGNDVQTTHTQTTTIQTTSTTVTSAAETTFTAPTNRNYTARLEWLRQALRRYGIELDELLGF